MKKKWILLLLLALFLTPINIYAQNFTDTEGHWAVVDIDYANNHNLANGYNGKFNPDNSITRGEYISLINRNFNLIDNSGELKFESIDKNQWYYNDILIGQNEGYINIFNKNELNPNQAITREEAGAILGKVLYKEELDNNNLVFSDSSRINSEYLPYIEKLVNNKILKGYSDNSFRPQDKLTKAEAIVMLLNSTNSRPAVANISNLKLVNVDEKTYLKDINNNAIFIRNQVKDGVVKFDDYTYIIGNDNAIIDGLVTIKDNTYYSTSEGLYRGWKEIDGNYHYFSPYNYQMYKNGVLSTGKNCYWFDANGKVCTGARPGGYNKKLFTWIGPDKEELSNNVFNTEPSENQYRNQEVANYASLREGIPFKWFGMDLNDKSGVYCCGATYSAFKELGINIPGPNDCNIKDEKGYAMVRAQYEQAGKYGGVHVGMDFNNYLPGDILFYKKPNGAYNHVGLFLGMNGDNPIMVHATYEDGFVTEPTSVTEGWKYDFLGAIRY